MSTRGAIDTLVRYKDSSGRERTKLTNRFRPHTQLTDINNWILSWWDNRRTYYILIKAKNGRYVDLDDNYIKDYEPFAAWDDTQSTTSESPVVDLQIIDNTGKIFALILIFFIPQKQMITKI